MVLLLWSLLLIVGRVASKDGSGKCGTYYNNAEDGCWVDPLGEDSWFECHAADEEACTANCDNPGDVATKCKAYEDKEGGKDEGKDEGKEWDDKEEKDVKEGGSYKFKHTWDGVDNERSYDLSKPDSTCTPKGLLVVLQPGSGGCGSLVSLATTNCIFLACPYSTPGGWKVFKSDAEDVDFIGALIPHISQTHSAPADKVIVTGFSAGASMAYKVGCARSSVIGGLAIYGQTFIEPAAGHIAKGEENPGMTTTQQILQMMEAARETSDKCDPQYKRPHYAVVGTSDNYYGEDNGAYKGKALWEFYSTNVLGCTGVLKVADSAEATKITGKATAECFMYPSCPGLDASSNKYCTVPGMGHDTDDWDVFVTKAFLDFFPSQGSTSEDGASSNSDADVSGVALRRLTVPFLVAVAIYFDWL